MGKYFTLRLPEERYEKLKRSITCVNAGEGCIQFPNFTVMCEECTERDLSQYIIKEEDTSEAPESKENEKLSKCDRCRNQKFDYGLMQRKCKFSIPQFPIEDEGDCEKYDNKYIEYPLTIEGIENHFKDRGSLYECGKLARIQPCGKEYEGKTFLGILLGDLPIGAHVSFSRKSRTLEVYPFRNPAIYVPDLKKIIYGCESWWGEIESPEDLKDITTDEIENTWYVRLLKEMAQTESKTEGGEKSVE